MPISKKEYIKLRQKGYTPEQIERASTGLPGFATGVGQGILSTAQGISKLGVGLTKGLGLDKLGLEGQTLFTPEQESRFQPVTTAEKVGLGTEKVAEFLLPSSKIAAISKTATIPGLTRGANVAARALIEGFSTGSTVAAQRGKIDKDTVTAALVSAAFPVVGRGLVKGKQLLGKGTQATGQKIQQTVIRPQAADLKDGFKIENVSKYDVGGSVAETATKVHVRLNNKAEQLNNLLKGIKPSKNTSADLNSVLTKTKQALQGDKAISFGSNKAIKNQLKNLGNEIDEVVKGKRVTDLFTATQVKRGAGTKGAWAFGRLDPEADAVEKVYSTFYRVLKDEIKNKAGKLGPEIDALNKEISELIPISNAALRRLPVDQRNNVISLTDGIGLFASVFDPKALAILGANKLSKSGKFGTFLVKFGEKMLKAPKSRIPLGGRFFGP